MPRGADEIDQDALLVAYLDGELQPELRRTLELRLEAEAPLRERLAVIAAGGRELRQSFDTLLDAAPVERLESALAAALSPASRRRRFRYREMILAAAASLLLVIGGGVAGYFVGKSPGMFEETDAFESDWIDAVAGQLSLYGGDALAVLPADDAGQLTQLSKVGEALKLDMPLPKLALDGLTLSRVELLNFKGRNVAELLYASAEHGPIAFCIALQPGGGGEEREVESRDGFNYTYWTNSGRRFLVIGAAPPARIDALAGILSARFGS